MEKSKFIEKRIYLHKHLFGMTNERNSNLNIVKVTLSCIFLGTSIGAITNMVNASVSPYYFQSVMRWNFTNIWGASVAQGIFEGTIYGIIFSFVFSWAFYAITKNQASYSFAFQQLYKICLFILVCWALGGLLAVLLASLSAEFFVNAFPLAPNSGADLLKFAWVGGSIWGSMAGSILGCLLGIFVTKNEWAKQTNLKTR